MERAMNEATTLPLQRPRRFYFDWVLPFLLRPRATFARIVDQPRATWLTPMLVLTLTSLLAVFAAGPIKTALAQSGQVELPFAYEWWTPEQQAAYMQSQASLTGPVFVYVFPALLAVLRVWLGWLAMGGVLYLTLTLLGGRGRSGGALDVVAWASLPFAVRDLVQAAFMFTQDQLLRSGLESYAPVGEGLAAAVVVEVLARVTIYGLWYLALLYIGVRAAGGLKARQALAGVALAVVVMLVLGLIPGVAGRLLGALSPLFSMFA
jgi:hypothetical protein